MNWNMILIIAAIVCFLLATYGANVKINLTSLGLALLSISFLV